MIFLSGNENIEELKEKFNTLQRQYVELEEEIEHLKETKELQERNYEKAKEIINEKVFK